MSIELLAVLIPAFLLITLGLLLLVLMSESRRQQTKSKYRYKRLPVIHPKRTSPNNSKPQVRSLTPEIEYWQKIRQSATKIRQNDNLKYPQPASSKPAPVSPPIPVPISKPLHVPDFKTFLRPNPLQPKLILLLNGDRQTAERLLRNARLRYPDKSEQWLFEKVIYDLTRDRA